MALSELTGRTASMDNGGRTPCADKDPDMFFSDSPKVIAQARELCAGCWYAERCAEIGKGQEYGIWGGVRSIPHHRPGEFSIHHPGAAQLFARIIRDGAVAVAETMDVNPRTVQRFSYEWRASHGLPGARIRLPDMGTEEADDLYAQMCAYPSYGSAAVGMGIDRATVARFCHRYDQAREAA